MFDPSTLTVGQILTHTRDVLTIFALVQAIWIARGAYGNVKYFIKRTKRHMVRVERDLGTMRSQLDVALNNHFKHMEHDLKVLSGRMKDDVNAPLESD